MAFSEVPSESFGEGFSGAAGAGKGWMAETWLFLTVDGGGGWEGWEGWKQGYGNGCGFVEVGQ